MHYDFLYVSFFEKTELLYRCDNVKHSIDTFVLKFMFIRHILQRTYKRNIGDESRQQNDAIDLKNLCLRDLLLLVDLFDTRRNK